MDCHNHYHHSPTWKCHWCRDSSALRAKVCYSLPSRRPPEESPERSRRRLEWRYPRCSTSGKSPDRYRADRMMLDVFGLHNRCHRLLFLGILSMIYECWEMYPNVCWLSLIDISLHITVDSAANFSHSNCQPSNKSYSSWPMRTHADRCDRGTSKAHANHDYNACSIFRTLQQVSHQLTDAF